MTVSSLGVLLSIGAMLGAAAASSPRPSACRIDGEHSAQAKLWSDVRPAAVERRCSALSRGFTSLEAAPSDALAAAHEVLKAAPEDRIALLLEGRALLRLGQNAEAWQRLSRFVAPGALEDAPSLYDVARAAVEVGELERAHTAYRALLPRALLLPSGDARRVAYMEAASVAMARGPQGLEEAQSYLEEAGRVPLPGDRDLLVGLGVLLLERSGHAERARAMAREAPDPWDLERLLSARERERLDVVDGAEPKPEKSLKTPRRMPRVRLPDGELHAVIALLAVGRDRELALAHQRAFLAGPGGAGPYAELVKRALGPGGRGR
jgi:tetratricopeptide (TPR) repeat protein